MFKATFNHPDNRTFNKPQGATFAKEQVVVRVTDVSIVKKPDGNAQALGNVRVFFNGVGIFDTPFYKDDFDYEKPAVEQMYNQAKQLKMTLTCAETGEEIELPYFEDIENY